MTKKRELNFNYYNIVYKYSKFHYTRYFFLKHIDGGGVFLNWNNLKKLYLKFYERKDYKQFKNSLGHIRDFTNRIDFSYKNFNFINIFNIKNQMHVLRIHYNNESNFKIYKYMSLLNIYKFYNLIYHKNLFLDTYVLNTEYFSNFFLGVSKSIFKYFKNILFKCIILKIFKNIFMGNTFKNKYLMDEFVFKSNNIQKDKMDSKYFFILLKVLKFFYKKNLIHGENLKTYLLDIYKKLLKSNDIKVPVFSKKKLDVNILKKKELNCNLKLKIFAVYNKSKRIVNKKTGFNFLILFYIQRCFLFLKHLDQEDKNDIDIFDYFYDFIYYIFLNSKNLLHNFLNKQINFQFIYEYKLILLESLYEEVEDAEEEDVFETINVPKDFKYQYNSFHGLLEKKIFNFKFLSYAYKIFFYEKKKFEKSIGMQYINTNFFNVDNYNNTFDRNLYFNFIFNTLEGKPIENFMEFYEKIKYNFIFLKNISIDLSPFFKKYEDKEEKKEKYCFNMKMVALNLIFLRYVNKRNQKYLKRKVEYFTKYFKNLFFKYFWFSLCLKKKSRLKKNLKMIFNIEKIDLPPLKKVNWYENWNLNKFLKFINFYNEIKNAPYYFKTYKVYCLVINKKSNNIVLYKKKFKNFFYSNTLLIKLLLKYFHLFKSREKKMFILYFLLYIYTKYLKYGFYLYKKGKIKAIKRSNRIRKRYLEIRNAYLKKVKIYLKNKEKYTIEYFQNRINKKPELLQSPKFNRKIVKYRAEPIYRVTPNKIRPNPRLNKIIWNWIAKRNARNRAARAFFKSEKNFRCL